MQNKKNWIPLVALLVAIAGLAWNMYSKEQASISITATSSISVIQGSGTEISDIKILYKENEVKNLTKLQIAIYNNGNRPLAPEDFVGPVTFGFAPKSVITASVERREPRQLIGALDVRPEEGIVRLIPELLNPGDVLTVAVYCTGGTVTLPEISGRIKGIKDISLVDKRDVVEQPWTRPLWLAQAAGYLLGLLIVILAIVYALRDLKHGLRRKRALPGIQAKIAATADTASLVGVLNSAGLDENLYRELLTIAYSGQPAESAKAYAQRRLPNSFGNDLKLAVSVLVILLPLALWCIVGLVRLFLS